jgi:acetyl-CoA/propionyl-CoA carboxylase, biotin carboxylase, biotin carboxyl carrier protein
MFESVLIANRGEIAVRIIATLRRLGVRSVAVYSDEDAGAKHVQAADVAVRLGPAAARESYLNVDRLLAAAATTGAEAVHPGYGFLAENAGFARACGDAGVVFIGPPVAAVEVMGDKIRAKRAVSAAGVPVVPGRNEAGLTDDDLSVAAQEIGYPVLVKPSAGGGGKGMRLVHHPADLAAALASARREALASFGDDTLFVERFVHRPRHIEVQVLADNFSAVVHLGERECSLQRRHQKVLEEAPSVLLDVSLRERYGALAVATASSVGYTGAGTVEFIVSGDRPDEPFFMEMNTRLQVEHPVTELITGLDLVEQQLRVAAGEPLSFGQADVVLRGHAVEARVYAESPAQGFVPTGGVPRVVREPIGAGVRVDSSIVEGVPVGTSYDPMLSKVIAWAPDRAGALARLDQALASAVILGVGTNITFLRALLAHPDVRAGQLDTGLVERDLDALVAAPVPDRAYIAFALGRLVESSATAVGPWDAVDGWRPGGRAATTWRLLDGTGDIVTVSITGGPTAATVRVGGGEPVAARAEVTAEGFLLSVDDCSSQVVMATVGDRSWLHLDGLSHELTEAPPPRRDGTADSHDGEINSPMPGSVVAVAVAEGAGVCEGEVLVVVEAMKMEHSLVAPFDGVVDVMTVRVGDRVSVGQLLARVRSGS